MPLRECMEKKQFLEWLLPPKEREESEEWKTGFYHIAKKAEVPILPIAFDWEIEMIFHPLFIQQPIGKMILLISNRSLMG